MRPLLLVLAMTTLTAAAADPALTIYRADGDALFAPGSMPLADGHAIVHEERALQLAGGRETLVIDGLPTLLDTEAVALDLGGSGRVLAQRIVAAGDAGPLGAHRGERVAVLDASGRSIVEGVLVAIDGGSLVVRTDDGRSSYVREFARVEFREGSGRPGSTLQVAVDGRAGTAAARLTYPTAGLGWRAAYAGLLSGEGGSCQLHLSTLASIANRSGRDWSGARLKLVAGSPNFARSNAYLARAPMAMKSMAAEAAPDALPAQDALGDYRSYAVDGSLDLPDGSITQVPLYAGADLPCARSWVFESGGRWFPSKPMLTPTGGSAGGPVDSRLGFTAAENLPAGTLRISMRDKDGRSEFVGESRIADTAKGREIDISLGQAFELSATRDATRFEVDRAARQLDEAFRVTLANAGDRPRTVTVREHPNQWRNWTLLSSSSKPTRQTPDTLEFDIEVPANGKATLDYAVRYSWTAADE
ncbi:MAG: DUF4139 domain-containing protein [Xanthomonadales bacterium]|nr:DUF4139 domain-containing protein [Xanthomonadales bacterium]